MQVSHLVWALSLTLRVTAFDPRAYPLEVARCGTVIRVEGVQEPASIDIHYADVNPTAKRTLLLVHGWPGGWSTFSNQIEDFEKDYHLAIPELRGFGASGHPGGVSRTEDIVNDLVCVLQHAKVQTAVCVGHDWGSSMCWEAARLRPDVFTAVIGLVVPYIPSAGPFIPIANLAKNFPRLTYQLFFDRHTKDAIAQLNADKRRTLRATYLPVPVVRPPGFLQSSDTYLGAWDSILEIPPISFFTQEEEDYLVERYEMSGFDNTLQFYLTEFRYGSYELAHTQGNSTIPQPALSVLPLHDPVGDWVMATKVLQSESFLPKITIKTVEGAHWPHLEYPERVNEIMRKWLDSVDGVAFPSLNDHDEL